jgi:hypothetical protein
VITKRPSGDKPPAGLPAAWGLVMLFLNMVCVTMAFADTRRLAPLLPTSHLLTCDLRRFDGVVAVGGDGTFHEVVSGILDRTQIDHEIAMDVATPTPRSPKITVGVLPGHNRSRQGVFHGGSRGLLEQNSTFPCGRPTPGWI